MQYLVEREQAGEAGKLKGYAIAVDVFERSVDFDPSTDTLVRVQVGRLRELLQLYFETEGALDPVRIVVPRGSYVPSYEINGVALAQSDVPDQQARPERTDMPEGGQEAEALEAVNPSLRRQLRLFWLAFGIVIAMLGVLIIRQGPIITASARSSTGMELPIATGSIPSTAVQEALPVVYLSAAPGSSNASRVAATLRAGLSGFDTIDFIGRAVPDDRDRSGDSTSFVFVVHGGPSPGGVTIELQNVATGRVLLSRNLAAIEVATQLEDRIAGLLSDTVPASGAIYSYIQQAGIQRGLTACLLLNNDYYLDQNAKTYKAAYQCLETLSDRGTKSPLVYSELAVLTLQPAGDTYGLPDAAAIEKAISLAHNAGQLGATSPYAARANGYINIRLGNPGEAARWMRKAYQLNSYDLGMAAAYGYALIFGGQYDQGTPVILRAVDASTAHPTWWDYGLFLGSLMRGDLATAERASRSLGTTVPKPNYLAARLICAHWSGDETAAAALRAELQSRFPAFVSNPGAIFAERAYPADLSDTLVRKLREAGLGGSS